jgi:hypothetical protein
MTIDIPPAFALEFAASVQLQNPATTSVSTHADRAVIILAGSPGARPGHVAEREELDAALKAGTIERLRLFIERHPQSRYRAEAEKALRSLKPTRTP